MRVIVVAATVLTVSIALACAAHAAPRKRYPVAERSAAGTVIQPTRTIIHHRDGTTTIIVTPRHRSYLDPGTEVAVGEGSTHDYMLPPGGDPGRPSWFYGPGDATGGAFMISRPYYLPGINTNTPY
jgi:hypothetical protein